LKSSDSGKLAVALRYAGVGITFVVEAGIVAWAGWWADQKFSTSPWLLVTGTMLGVVLATISLIRSVESLGGENGEGGDESEGGQDRPSGRGE